MNRRSLLCFSAFIFFLALSMPSCSREKVTVAIMTRLESGSIVGTSEINMAKIYLEENRDNNISIYSIDDKWDPGESEKALGKIIGEGIGLLVTSHTSTCAVRLMDRINQKKILTLVTGATTDVLSRRDDYIFRNVQDVEIEQKSIAGCLDSLPGRDVLVLRDTENSGYTEPALRHLRKYLRKGITRTIDVSARALDIPALRTELTGQAFDVAYILVGGYQSSAAGTLAQLLNGLNPSCTIVFTPWVRSQVLLESAGKAIGKCVLPSHYPARGSSPVISKAIDDYKKRFGYAPTYISFNVYGALQILDEAVKNGCRTPDDIRRYILGKKTFRTKFITVTFNGNGDTVLPLYFITDIEREF